MNTISGSLHTKNKSVCSKNSPQQTSSKHINNIKHHVTQSKGIDFANGQKFLTGNEQSTVISSTRTSTQTNKILSKICNIIVEASDPYKCLNAKCTKIKRDSNMRRFTRIKTILLGKINASHPNSR